VRGRKPSPESLKRLSEKWSVADGPPPDPPEWLDAEAKAEWQRIVPHLARLIGELDLSLLEAYCRTYAMWRLADRQVRDEGQTFVDTHGNPHVHPAVKTSMGLLAEMRRMAAEFGFSPAARSRIDVPRNPEGDEAEFDAFQRTRSADPDEV